MFNDSRNSAGELIISRKLDTGTWVGRNKLGKGTLRLWGRGKVLATETNWEMGHWWMIVDFGERIAVGTMHA